MAIPTFTLDTNCIIDIDEGRPNAGYIQQLVRAHNEGTASVALIAMSASESQKSGRQLDSFAEFTERTAALGLGALEMVYPMFIFDISYWDNALWTDEKGIQLQRVIHRILFPTIPDEWESYCSAHGVAPLVIDTNHFKKWKNALCDVQAYWAHANAKRDVFVTQDCNFLKSKKQSLISLCGGRIETPAAATALLI